MERLLYSLQHELFDPRTLVGAVCLGVVFAIAALILAGLVRRAARRVAEHLSDVAGLAFASSLDQVFVYVVALILYAHLIPELRSVGTALLAGAGVVSVIVGFAAQSTLSNVVAGFSLIMWRPIRVGDRVHMSTPKGLVTATAEAISLGYTILRSSDEEQILVPNSTMTSRIVIGQNDKGQRARLSGG